jgi:hypothetical protein
MPAAPVGGASLGGAIAEAIAADPDRFTDEQTTVALAACEQTFTDWALFKQALARLGPTLGVVGDPTSVSSADRRVLYDPQLDPDTAGVDPIVGPLALNEISAVSAEYVELMNVGTTTQPIAGYSIADADVDGGPRFAQATPFASGATLAPGERLVTVGGFSPPAQGLQTDCLPNLATCYQAAWDISGSDGETMFLLSPAGVIVDQAKVSDDVAAGQSWSRLPDGSGPFAVGAATPGGANAASRD